MFKERREEEKLIKTHWAREGLCGWIDIVQIENVCSMVELLHLKCIFIIFIKLGPVSKAHIEGDKIL